jgi:YfiH family protein
VPTLSKARAAKVRRSQPLQILEAPALQRVPWLVHGFSTRAGGATTAYGGRTLNMGFTKDDLRERVERNRSRMLLAAGAADKNRPWPLFTLRQIHSDLIHVVRSREPQRLTGDGLVTDLTGVALGILTADCFPVLLVDARRRAVGAFHAGWRGTVKRIVEKGVGIMRLEFGSRAEDIYAAIGPGIQSCSFEVGEEVEEAFHSQFDYAAELFHRVQESDPVREKYPLLFMNQRPPGHGNPCIKLHLDLREANRRQLLAAGVLAANITALEGCTVCSPRKFFSHRKEKGHTGRMLALVGIKRSP